MHEVVRFSSAVAMSLSRCKSYNEKIAARDYELEWACSARSKGANAKPRWSSDYELEWFHMLSAFGWPGKPDRLASLCELIVKNGIYDWPQLGFVEDPAEWNGAECFDYGELDILRKLRSRGQEAPMSPQTPKGGFARAEVEATEGQVRAPHFSPQCACTLSWSLVRPHHHRRRMGSSTMPNAWISSNEVSWTA